MRRRIVLKDVAQRVPMLANGALLAGGGGFLDGFTYVGHGQVFANAMTGNVVLLGIYCISGSWRTGFRHLPAILAFLVGISAARALRLPAAQRRIGQPFVPVLGIEICILLLLSLLPNSTANPWITTSIAFAASLQIGTFREVNGRSYASTFTTGNLRTMSEAAFDWVFEERSKESAKIFRDFFTICACFLLGAMAGGYVTPRLGNHALWVVIAVLIVVALRLRPWSYVEGAMDGR